MCKSLKALPFVLFLSLSNAYPMLQRLRSCLPLSAKPLPMDTFAQTVLPSRDGEHEGIVNFEIVEAFPEREEACPEGEDDSLGLDLYDEKPFKEPVDCSCQKNDGIIFIEDVSEYLTLENSAHESEIIRSLSTALIEKTGQAVQLIPVVKERTLEAGHKAVSTSIAVSDAVGKIFGIKDCGNGLGLPKAVCKVAITTTGFTITIVGRLTCFTLKAAVAITPVVANELIRVVREEVSHL